jgi:hypothetical protein
MVCNHLRHTGLVCLIAVGLTLCFAALSNFSPVDRENARTAPTAFFHSVVHRTWRRTGLAWVCVATAARKYSPLTASLILAPLWTIWHLPLIGNEFPWPIVLPFVLSVFGATFMLTWVFNGTKGSVLSVMLFHATVNTIGAGLIFPLFSGAALTLLWWIYGFVWLCAGLGAICFNADAKLQAASAPSDDLCGNPVL